MILPNFLIVGAQKSGTTTLYDILNNHPEVNMSSMKEINYYTSTSKQKKGLKYYSSFFKKPEALQKAIGEVSPGYMNNLDIPKKIKNDLGDVKIIMILRDPIKRALSQYWDNRRRFNEPLEIDGIIDKYLSSNYSKNSKGYFSRGVYVKYINEYLKFFKKPDVLVLIFEELIKNSELELKKVYNFLEIDDSDKYLRLIKKSNSSTIWNNSLYNFLLNNPTYTKYLNKHFRRFFFFGKKVPYKYPEITKKQLDILKEFYKPWNKELELFLNKKLTHWI